MHYLLLKLVPLPLKIFSMKTNTHMYFLKPILEALLPTLKEIHLLLLDFVPLGGPIQFITVWFQAHKHRFMIRHLCKFYTNHLMHHGCIFQHLLAPINTSLFQHLGYPMRRKLFDGQIFIQYLIDDCHSNGLECLNLMICHMKIFLYYFTHSIDVL